MSIVGVAKGDKVRIGKEAVLRWEAVRLLGTSAPPESGVDLEVEDCSEEQAKVGGRWWFLWELEGADYESKEIVRILDQVEALFKAMPGVWGSNISFAFVDDTRERAITFSTRVMTVEYHLTTGQVLRAIQLGERIAGLSKERALAFLSDRFTDLKQEARRAILDRVRSERDESDKAEAERRLNAMLVAPDVEDFLREV